MLMESGKPFFICRNSQFIQIFFSMDLVHFLIFIYLLFLLFFYKLQSVFKIKISNWFSLLKSFYLIIFYQLFFLNVIFY